MICPGVGRLARNSSTSASPANPTAPSASSSRKPRRRMRERRPLPGRRSAARSSGICRVSSIMRCSIENIGDFSLGTPVFFPLLSSSSRGEAAGCVSHGGLDWIALMEQSGQVLRGLPDRIAKPRGSEGTLGMGYWALLPWQGVGSTLIIRCQGRLGRNRRSARPAAGLTWTLFPTDSPTPGVRDPPWNSPP